MDEWLYEYHVGEVVPGAEDPNYNAHDPMHLEAWGKAHEAKMDPLHLRLWGQQHAAQVIPGDGSSGWTSDPVGTFKAQSGTTQVGIVLGVVAVVTKLLHVW